ncbi:hypothetical protein D1P53_005683 [Cryptococcus gattii VGV]|nr:hypothetical protein D1P53_005683 [Cryptococcus gattii VGV]
MGRSAVVERDEQRLVVTGTSNLGLEVTESREKWSVNMPPKRPAPSRSHAQNKYPRQETVAPAARIRAIKNVPGPTEEESDMNEEMKAKLARKEARTIRNRESAQRSRNQRKAYLAWLENRVLELETENQALRGAPSDAESKVKEESVEKVTERTGYSRLRTSSSASKSSSSSVHPFFTSAATSTLTRCSSHPNLSYSRTGVPSREPSPAHSVLSLATDLGLPTELVSGGAGVRLASVTPPSKGMLSEMGVDDDDDDVRGVGSGDRIGIGNLLHSRLGHIQPSPNSFEEEETQLKEENALLRERVGLLENLVRQVVVLSNLDPNSALLPISVSMPNVSAPAPALPSSMLSSTPLPTPGLALSQMSLPMPILGLNSKSISMPTPLSPYSASKVAGAMQATRTGNGAAANILRVGNLWAQESTHAGQQPDSGAPGAQSYPSQFYIPNDYVEELAHPSHIPPPRPLSVQVGQPLGQVEQAEQRQQCAHLGYVRSTASAAGMSPGLEATLPPQFLPRGFKFFTIRSGSSTNNNSNTGFDPLSDSNSNTSLHLHSADNNSITPQQFHSGMGQDAEESTNFVSLSQGPMTSTSALPTTSSLSTSLSTSTSTFSSDPTATSIFLSTSLSSNSSSTSTYSINQTEVKHNSVACHSAEVATSFPVSFISLSLTAADAQMCGMGGMEGSVEEKEISKEDEETMAISSEGLSCSTSTSPKPHLSQTFLNHPRANTVTMSAASNAIDNLPSFSLSDESSTWDRAMERFTDGIEGGVDIMDEDFVEVMGGWRVGDGIAV